MRLRISTAPHIRSGATTQRIMMDVCIALVPCIIMGVYRFGLSAALLIGVCALTAVVTEFAWQKLTKREVTVQDFSALVTGLILGLNLPPTAPWWVAMIGSVFAILIVKQLFGGIGGNFVNPAMAARAVLLASWPVHMTTYVISTGAFTVDALSGATPLITQNASYYDLLMGNIPGAIGEVCKLGILLGLLYLLLTKVISWRIPVTVLVATALMTLILGGDPLYAVLSGGVMFGAVFMATDYTTNPMTARGQVLFAAGVGVIVAVIRTFGAYPEGVTYAILLMNIATPLIDKYMKPRLYGRPKKERKVKEVKADA
ncbi:RnfABCDGE type electron transport complex subunit D [Christensenellaceae bacterium OttesenSCG-928-L17]|nr:RnfABCDGE type electron transport complex subunit D [Christensenellaceae bacterium OttesenSCG-928-L17]